jgi:hypothetical protein
MGAGSSAIAAAASQALAATHYNVPGRRSSSLKAGLEKTRVFKQITQPSGFFWFFLGFLGFLWFFYKFFQKRKFLGFFQFQEYFQVHPEFKL